MTSVTTSNRCRCDSHVDHVGETCDLHAAERFETSGRRPHGVPGRK